MGQRDGFAPSDLAKLNKMYNCDNVPAVPNQGIRPTNTRPTNQKPNRPNFAGPATSGGGGGSSGNGNGGFTNPIAQVISGIGGFFHALGGKHDEAENQSVNNEIDEN